MLSEDGQLLLKFSVLQLVSRHVIENQEISFKKFGTELRRVVGLHQILAGNVISYMLRTTASAVQTKE